MRNLLLLPVRICTAMLRKISDLFLSAMRMSALNWLSIGRKAADAGLDVADGAKMHAKELAQRIHADE